MQENYHDFMPYLGFVIKMKIEEIRSSSKKIDPSLEEIDNGLPFPNMDFEHQLYFPDNIELVFDDVKYYFINPQNDYLPDYNGYMPLRGIMEQLCGIFYGMPSEGQLKLISKSNMHEEYEKEVLINNEELEPLVKLEKMLHGKIIPWQKDGNSEINPSWTSKYIFQSENGRKYLHWMRTNIFNEIFTCEVNYIRQEEFQVPCKITVTQVREGRNISFVYSFADHKINKKGS